MYIYPCFLKQFHFSENSLQCFSAIIINIVESLYCGHLGDLVKRPVQKGVLILGINLYEEAYLGHS